MKSRADIKEIDVMDHLGDIIKGVEKGVLLTTKSGEKVNSMTISWGHIGIEWNKLIFIAYVRTGRYTHKMLEDSKEFGVNMAMGQTVGKILSYCGTKSGAEVDKIKDLGLTIVPANKISTPGIKELPFTLECKVIYEQLQDKKAFSEDILQRFYPSDKESSFHGSNGDLHTMFYGEIVGAHIIQ
jgi:flavin reductase (DIM6/NTAB) family NADH-FMN oxidoreductase RutF